MKPNKLEVIESAIEDVLHAIETQEEGELREGLQETPKRVSKAMAQWFGGYDKDAGEILKVFKDGATGVNDIVAVVDIPFYSHCEHHMASIFGTATVAYIPNGKIVGLSKLSRLVDMHARRLQVQERLTNDIAKDLFKHLEPLAAGVIIKARHMCMESRGICQAGHHTRTIATKGLFLTDKAKRAEFLALDK